MTNRAVFLDRDGVINRYAYNSEFGTVDTPANPAEFHLLDGAAEAIAEFNGLGVPVIVVSNQPGIAKGKLSPSLLDAIDAEMRSQLARSGARIDAAYYCLHHPDAAVAEYRADCDCRKPKPGLLLRAARERNLDIAGSFLIGDDVSDVLAGRAAGVTTMLLSPHRCTLCDEFSSRGAVPDVLVQSLKDAAGKIGRMISDGNGEFISSAQHAGPCVLDRGHSTYARQYLREAVDIAEKIDAQPIERAANLLRDVRERGGRLFLLGVGGGAGHASHAACDFRKIAGIESYCVTDNVSELTARVNDEGWDTSYRNWLRASRLGPADALLVFSVGGGDIEKNVSANLVSALLYAREKGAAIAGIVGRDGGATAQLADVCILVPVVNPKTITPHTESFQALVWHLLVSHPALKAAEMKWESLRANVPSAPAAAPVSRR
ncbi:MAG TPA: HAD-IIIA family hydrolase [Verrucomicrobiae bacterium]|nr:HAD-IIIA family hydrolase [Verrucomicrobiae bacterium]